MIGFVFFFFQWYGDHRDLHRVDRRQRQMCIRDRYMGDVIGDLNSKRGQVNSMEDRNDVKVINAEVPLAEMFGYATSLRSMTQGRGSYTMEFDHYAPVPSNVQQLLIEGKNKK